MKEQIIRLVKSLENRGENFEEKKDLSPSCSKLEVFYSLAKIHESLEDGTPSFHPILSAIGTPIYNLGKFCN